ncbi:MAG: substrate-binding domain-containing protein, partial [Chitinophagaceae bacterium]|nr:substrate-binding domain-containing protein [Chitinophagaceae bacterium]
THEDYEKEKSVLHLQRSGRVDGLMISVADSTRNVEHLREVAASEMPMVLFDRVCEELDVPKVTTDDEEVSFKGTDQLLKSGCRKVAFFSMSEHLSISTRRKRGYLRALKKHGIHEPDILMDFSSSDDVENRRQIRNVLSGGNRPDGVFVAVERLAINIYEVCHELQIRIPEDLKVISFSNLSACGLFNPPLTTIFQPAFEIGKEGAEILFKLIGKKKLLPQEKELQIPSVIEMRSSTGI